MFQPDQFWNADHEKLYKRILVLLLFLTIATIISVEIYFLVQEQGKQHYKIVLSEEYYSCRTSSVIHRGIPNRNTNSQPK